MINNGFKYKIGETLTGEVEINVFDEKNRHNKYIKKHVTGEVVNSTPLLVCGKIENWYTLLCKYDMVFNVCESDVIENV